MPHERGCIAVHLAGATIQGKVAKFWLTQIPHGFRLIGDVVRGDGTGGLLVRSDQSGRFLCWDGKVLSELPQRRTRDAVAAVIPAALPEAPPPKPMPPRATASMASAIQSGGSRSVRWRHT